MAERSYSEKVGNGLFGFEYEVAIDPLTQKISQDYTLNIFGIQGSLTAYEDGYAVKGGVGFIAGKSKLASAKGFFGAGYDFRTKNVSLEAKLTGDVGKASGSASGSANYDPSGQENSSVKGDLSVGLKEGRGKAQIASYSVTHEFDKLSSIADARRLDRESVPGYAKHTAFYAPYSYGQYGRALVGFDPIDGNALYQRGYTDQIDNNGRRWGLDAPSEHAKFFDRPNIGFQNDSIADARPLDRLSVPGYSGDYEDAPAQSKVGSNDSVAKARSLDRDSVPGYSGDSKDAPAQSKAGSNDSMAKARSLDRDSVPGYSGNSKDAPAQSKAGSNDSMAKARSLDRDSVPGYSGDSDHSGQDSPNEGKRGSGNNSSSKGKSSGNDYSGLGGQDSPGEGKRGSGSNSSSKGKSSGNDYSGLGGQDSPGEGKRGSGSNSSSKGKSGGNDYSGLGGQDSPGEGKRGSGSNSSSKGKGGGNDSSSKSKNDSGSDSQPDNKGDSNTSSGRLGGRVPVVLDLEGNGFDIDMLSSSSFFVELNGDGYQTRSAWAGNGSGVLVIDADRDNKISQEKEFAFTPWDETSTSDLQAIKNVFDTNHNSKLDAGDSRWSDFKVWVNGELVSLKSLGITTIDLNPTGSSQTFTDGSAITGTTTYTKSDGTTGAVGDAIFASDTNSYKIDRQTLTNTDASKTTTILGYRKDGKLAFRNIVTESADGKTHVTQYDDDGSGVFNRSQNDNLVIHVDGSRTQTISNLDARDTLVSRTAITTSADGKQQTMTVDRNGDDLIDQTQNFAKSIDGSSSTTVKQLNADGKVTSLITETANADGLTEILKVDANGDDIFEKTVAKKTVINIDGSRTTTTSETNADGTSINKVISTTSADSRTTTIDSDHDGNGSYDLRTISSTSVDKSGTVKTIKSFLNIDGSLLEQRSTIVSPEGLTKTTEADILLGGSDNIAFDAGEEPINIWQNLSGIGYKMQSVSEPAFFEIVDKQSSQETLDNPILGNPLSKSMMAGYYDPMSLSSDFANIY
jgi:hypothetical protein